MELYIGENIKRLRREKGITQETLADFMHVSAAAVSKWERGETFPDISMVIPLASYFGVSTDEILGVCNAKNEETIQKYLNESDRLNALGKSKERFDLIVKAYSEFPNDWRIVEAYLWQLNYDPNHWEEPYGFKVHKEELYRLCDRVLNECPVDKTRYAALSIIGGLYLADGKKEKAIETAKRFPDYWTTEGEELEGCYDSDNGEYAEWIAQLRKNIEDIAYLFVHKLIKATLHAKDIDTWGQLQCFQKAVSFLKLIYDEDDYGFYNQEMSSLYLWIANRYVMLNDFEHAFENYRLGFRYAKAYDDLPNLKTHTSFFVRGNVLDRAKTGSTSEDNMVKMQIDRLRAWEIYEAVKDTPEMKALLREYEPFAGKKKEYRK
jgi:transcriptional regulator with XRE-family HTH domain